MPRAPACLTRFSAAASRFAATSSFAASTSLLLDRQQGLGSASSRSRATASLSMTFCTELSWPVSSVGSCAGEHHRADPSATGRPLVVAATTISAERRVLLGDLLGRREVGAGLLEAGDRGLELAPASAGRATSAAASSPRVLARWACAASSWPLAALEPAVACRSAALDSSRSSCAPTGSACFWTWCFLSLRSSATAAGTASDGPGSAELPARLRLSRGGRVVRGKERTTGSALRCLVERANRR